MQTDMQFLHRNVHKGSRGLVRDWISSTTEIVQLASSMGSMFCSWTLQLFHHSTIKLKSATQILFFQLLLLSRGCWGLPVQFAVVGTFGAVGSKIEVNGSVWSYFFFDSMHAAWCGGAPIFHIQLRNVRTMQVTCFSHDISYFDITVFPKLDF